MGNQAQDNADRHRKESLVSVQDAFAVESTIASNLLNYIVGKGDAYLIGGFKELMNAMSAVKEAVSVKVALNGLAVEDAKQKHEGQ